MDRRAFLTSLAALSVLPRTSLAQGRAKTLRFVPNGDLSMLDPMMTVSTATTAHGYAVFDTLFSVDSNYVARPQMISEHSVSADGLVYEFQLRDGLTFHDASKVTAADCIASVKRWTERDAVGRLIGRRASSWEVVDDRTFRITLAQPFPMLVDALAKPMSIPAFVMPARLAETPPTTPITEMIGSGPFRFKQEEYRPGNIAVYERFEDYVPRSEPPDALSGGKIAYFDRIEWHIIPDRATAVSALMSGEVDWLHEIEPALTPLVANNPEISVGVRDPGGVVNMLRFNHLQAPFNNPLMRRAIMLAVNPDDYTSIATANDPSLAVDCPSLFPCTLPFARQFADEKVPEPNIEAAIQLIKEAGYSGQKVVLLNTVEISGAAGQITADLFRRLGLTVELVEGDFAASLKQRANRGPVEEGGWSAFHTRWFASAIATPLENVTLRGVGETGWSGWYQSEEMERLVDSWVLAKTDEERASHVRAMHELAMKDLPSIPLGMQTVREARRNTITDVLGGTAAVAMWGVKPA